jgi:hypothetical protein
MCTNSKRQYKRCAKVVNLPILTLEIELKKIHTEQSAQAEILPILSPMSEFKKPVFILHLFVTFFSIFCFFAPFS